MYLKQNKTTNGTKHELELNIPDGKHILWIEAKDQDNNFDISKAIPVEKRVNNFTVQIGSLDKISYLTSPQIKFIVTHKDQNQKVSYVVHVDKEITVNGEGSPFMEKTVMMNLTEGEHTIYVTATDQMNNSAISWPYYIIVGSDEEPQMYEAIIDWYE